MQQIYMQSDEQFEVFTTVFSPQVCRSRVRTRPTDEDKVVATINYRAHCPEELDLSHGDVIQVLLKEDPSWWFGRLHNGNEGYFPSACVTTRGPVQHNLFLCFSAGNGLGTPKLPRKNSIRRALALDSPSTMGSPSLLHRVLAKSRRKSCPHLPHVSADPGSINSAYLPD
ncbi:unnamed protein product [Merluccius merluccius]